MDFPSASARIRIALVIGCALIFIGLTLHYAIAIGPNVLDDAYIFFRYADNCSSGHGLVYNPGEPVEGYTSFLWVMILTFGAKLGLPLVLCGQMLGILFGLLTLWMVYRISEFLFPEHPWLNLLPVLILASNRTFTVWAVECLETKLFSFLLVSAVFVWVRYPFEDTSRSKFPLIGLILGLLILTRPEGFLFASIILAITAWLQSSRSFWINAATFGAIAAGHSIFRFLYYGTLVPNTFTAKVTGFQPEMGLRYILTLLEQNYLVWLSLFLVAGIVSIFMEKDHRIIKSYSALVTILILAYLFYIGGDYFEFRFLDMILPFMAILMLAGILTLTRCIPGQSLRRAFMASAATFWIVLNALPVLMPFQGETWLTTPEQEKRYTHVFLTAGQWLKQNMAPGESLAIRPAGAIAYITQAPCLDLLGLNDRKIALQAHNRKATSSSNIAGHQFEVSPDYARARGITYYIGHPQITATPIRDPRFACVEIQKGVYFTFFPLSETAKYSPGFYPAASR